MLKFYNTVVLFFVFLLSVEYHTLLATEQKQDSIKKLLLNYDKVDTFRVNRLIDLAALIKNDESDELYQYATNIDSISELISYDYGKASSSKILGEYYRKNYKLKESISFFNNAIKVFDKEKHKYEIAYCQLMNGRNFYSLGQFSEALVFLKQCKQVFSEIDDIKKLANSNYLIGVSYSRLGDYTSALNYTEKALVFFERDSNKRGMAGANHMLGIICNYQGNYPKTIEYYDRAFKIRTELNDKEGMSALYMSIGIIYYYQKDYDTALDYLQRSLQIAIEIDEKILISQCYNNISGVYTDQREFDKAMEFNKKSMDIKKELEDESGMASCYINFGNIYIEKSNHKSALDNYQKALLIANKIEEVKLKAEAYAGIANVYLQLNENKKAYKSSKKAYELAMAVDNINILKTSAEILALSSEAMHLYKEAFDAHKVFKTYNDSINSENSISEIARLKYKLLYEEEMLAKSIEQQKKEAILEAKSKRQRMILIGFMSGFVLAVLLMLLFRVRLSKAYKELKDNNIILNQAKEQAEESDRLKSAFLNNLSHEIRTPMNGIIGFSNILINSELTEDEQKEYGDIVLNSCDQLLLIIDDIVDMSELQSGNVSVHNSAIDLKAICSRLISDFKDQAQFKGINLEGCKKGGSVEKVMGDEEKILKIFHHLIDNAIKFTPKGTINIGASIKEGMIEFFVADSGIGIDPELHQRIFDSFYQAEYNSTRFYGGNGLGLTICKSMVELMKGKIWVHSKPGEGAVFYFTIPYVPANSLNQNDSKIS